LARYLRQPGGTWRMGVDCQRADGRFVEGGKACPQASQQHRAPPVERPAGSPAGPAPALLPGQHKPAPLPPPSPPPPTCPPAARKGRC
jgi:hypothetical protein